MTETTTEEVKAPAVQLDDFGQMAVERYTASVNEYNGLVAVIKAASGSYDDVLESVKSDSSNPQIEKINLGIVKHEEAIQKLTAELDALARPIADERVKGGAKDVEAEIAKADALHKTVKSGRTYLIDSYGEGALEGVVRPPVQVAGVVQAHADDGARLAGRQQAHVGQRQDLAGR